MKHNAYVIYPQLHAYQIAEKVLFLPIKKQQGIYQFEMDYYSFPKLASDSFCKICPFLSKENFFYFQN